MKSRFESRRWLCAAAHWPIGPAEMLMWSESKRALQRFTTRPRGNRGIVVLSVLATLAAWVPAERAFGQAEVRNLTQPIPVINTGGHSAPVRALVFAPPDGAQLLSAGFDKII